VTTIYSFGLTFPGTCEQAFTFYKSVFGGEFTDFIRYSEDPTTDSGTPNKDKNKIAYVELPLGGIRLYGDDTLENSGVKITPGNNMSVTIEPDNKKEADRIFKELSAGSKVTMPLTDLPWGYCGGLVDKFGVKWGVWYKPPRSPK
jgi:PhnB protein